MRERGKKKTWQLGGAPTSWLYGCSFYAFYFHACPPQESGWQQRQLWSRPGGGAQTGPGKEVNGIFHIWKEPPPPIIARLKGRVLRLCFHMLRIHYCFSLIPSERHWQMKLKYAADTQQQTPRLLSTTVSLPQRVCKFLRGNALRAKKKKNQNSNRVMCSRRKRQNWVKVGGKNTSFDKFRFACPASFKICLWLMKKLRSSQRFLFNTLGCHIFMRICPSGHSSIYWHVLLTRLWDRKVN